MPSLRDELARLDAVRRLGLPDGLLADWSPAELEASRQRIAAKASYVEWLALIRGLARTYRPEPAHAR